MPWGQMITLELEVETKGDPTRGCWPLIPRHPSAPTGLALGVLGCEWEAGPSYQSPKFCAFLMHRGILPIDFKGEVQTVNMVIR